LQYIDLPDVIDPHKERIKMEKSENSIRVLIIHGPNLNMLGKREPDIYGATTLESINDSLKELGRTLDLELETYQTNHEGAICEKIQHAAGIHHGLIINPAAFTHTSIAIRDALLLLDIPIIEVHLSNIYQREPFRQKSMISDVVTAQITGLGEKGYTMALEALAGMIYGKGS
jgi:3-dehydroquinate dehydratase-2